MEVLSFFFLPYQSKVNMEFAPVKKIDISCLGKSKRLGIFCSCRRHLAAVFTLAHNLAIRWLGKELKMYNIVPTLCTYSPFPWKHVILYFPWCY